MDAIETHLTMEEPLFPLDEAISATALCYYCARQKKSYRYIVSGRDINTSIS